MRRAVAALVLSALVPTVVVALPTVSASAAAPHPVAPTIHTLALNGVDGSALHALSLSRSTDTPSVLTGEERTAGYSAIGVTWQRPPDGAPAPDLEVQVRTYDGSWQPWTTLEADADVPTGQGAEAGNGRAGTDPYFAGPSTGVQVRVDVVRGALPLGLRAELIDPGTSPADASLNPTAISTASAAQVLPKIVTRAQWGADEKLRNGAPTLDPVVKMAFIHHTASQNNYTRAQAPAAVRAIYAYDTNGLGWTDIAYNVLVDKFGDVFEGRYGGLERAIRSAATGGFNPETFSVSALGTFTDVQPSSAMLTSMERVLAWKLGLYHLNPVGTVTMIASNGTPSISRFPNGTAHTFAVISGHRDAGQTQCPGQMIYDKLPAIRAAVKKLMGAAILAPTTSTLVVEKGTQTPVTVTATAMNAQRWQLLVANSAGHVVRRLTGSAQAGAQFTATWDDRLSTGTRVLPGVYTLTLSSWTSAAAAVPYLVNVSVDPNDNLFVRSASGGSIKLQGLGYGHGHGMSQFGAAGAAIKGLGAAQIVAFYYPGTTLTTVPTTTRIRVRLLGRVRLVSGAPDVRVKAAPGLWVSDGTRVLRLPPTIGTKSISVWRARLNANGHLDLYGLHGSSSLLLKGWSGLSTPLRFTSTPGAPFTSPPGAPTTSRVTVLDTNGGLRTYRGTIEAVPDAAGQTLYVVSDVRLDDYVKAVVSSEMPGGWLDPAYQAQAIAARSYALYKAQHAAKQSLWDLVDSTMDQVYSGFSGETVPESRAATATAGQYLAYAGKAIFAQYGSADGGWTSAGGHPYLPAKADPYDGVLQGTANWGHAWAVTIAPATVQATWPSIGNLQSVNAVARDGHGSWGGRTTSVVLTGSAGSLTVSGTSFRIALGLRSEWWRINPTPAQPAWPPPVPSGPASNKAAPSPVQAIRSGNDDRGADVSWRAPRDDGNSAVIGYHVTVAPGGQTYDLPATASSVFVRHLLNGVAYVVTVAARNAIGLSSVARVTVHPTSPWLTYLPTVATPVRTLALHAGKPVSLSLAAAVPASGVGAVSVRVVARGASVPGAVRVSAYSTGLPGPILQTSPGRSVVATAVVPWRPGGRITVRADAATTLDVTVIGYWTSNGAVGQRFTAVTPSVIGSGLASANNRLLVNAFGPAIPSTATGVWVSVTASAAVETSVSLATVLHAHSVAALDVPAGRTRSTTAWVPLGASGAFVVTPDHLAQIGVSVLGYTVADDGVTTAGRYQPLPRAAEIYAGGAGTGHSGLLVGVRRAVAVLGLGGLPATGVQAVLLRVSVPPAGAAGWLTAGAHGAGAAAVAQVLSFDKGAGGSALVLVRPGANGWIDLTAYGAATGVHVEALGWWSS